MLNLRFNDFLKGRNYFLILLRPKLLSQCLAVKSVLRKISLGGLLRISVDAFDKGQAYKDRMEVSKKNVDVFMGYIKALPV